MRSQEQINEIVRLLLEEYPQADCTLDWRKDYELLFSVRLAAQCTDERVNKITPALFERFPTLESFAAADVGEVEKYVHSCGFYRAKARDFQVIDGKIMPSLSSIDGLGDKAAEAVVDVRTWRRQAVRIRQAFRMPLPRRKRHLRHSLHKNSTEIHDCVYL